MGLDTGLLEMAATTHKERFKQPIVDTLVAHEEANNDMTAEDLIVAERYTRPSRTRRHEITHIYVHVAERTVVLEVHPAHDHGFG